MDKSKLLRQVEQIKTTKYKYSELVIFGNIDSQEEKWITVTFGAFSKDHVLMEQDIADRVEYVDKWLELVGGLDNDCCGVNLYGKIKVLGVINGNDPKRVAIRVTELVKQHWQNMTRQAISEGMAHG